MTRADTMQVFANVLVPATEDVIKSDEDEINDVKFQFTITRA